MAIVSRWSQADPEEGDRRDPTTLNAYIYAGGSPINRTDTSGRFWDELGELYGIAGDCYDGAVLGAAGGGAVGAFFAGIGAVPGATIGVAYGCPAGIIWGEVTGLPVLPPGFPGP